MKRYNFSVAVVFLVLATMICEGQDKFFLPKISDNGKSVLDFIPPTWKIRDTVSGDFNNDLLMDLAVVIETKEPSSFEDTTCFSSQPFYPKALLVLLQQQDKSLRLSTSATKLFGDCNWGVQGFDPFDKMEVRRKTLGILFLTGGTLRNQLSYYFRFQNDDWFLIGAESYQYWAGHTDGAGSFYNEKINFLTRFKETYDEDQNHKQSNYKKSVIEKKPLIKLTELDDMSDNYQILFGDGM